MFGFKIIKESEYRFLKFCESSHRESEKVTECLNRRIEKLSKDCDSLRLQLNERIREVFALEEQIRELNIKKRKKQ